MIDIVLTLNDISVEDFRDKGWVPKTYQGSPISVIDQAVVLIQSIKKNWTMPSDIIAMHSLKMSRESWDRLTEAGATVLERQHGFAGFDAVHNRWTAYQDSYRTNNTHRLILDVDMIALKDPGFSLDYDIMAGLSGYCVLDREDWQYICGVCGVDMPEGKIIKPPGSPWREYARGGSGFFPCFNAGAVLIEKNLAHSIIETIVDYMRKIRASTLSKNMRGAFAYTIALSLAIAASGASFALFPAGFNFIGTMLAPKDYAGEVFLYHYLGAERTELSGIYGNYFGG